MPNNTSTDQRIQHLIDHYNQVEYYACQTVAQGAWDDVKHANTVRTSGRVFSRMFDTLRKKLLTIDPNKYPNELLKQAVRETEYDTLLDNPHVNTSVLRLADELASGLKTVNTAILRTTHDEYRNIVQAVAAFGLTDGDTRIAMTEEMATRWAQRGIRPFIDKAGRHWPTEAYLKMATRTTVIRAQNEARVERFRATGTQLIVVSQHVDPSEQCAPYQGKILSLDGVAGARTVTSMLTGKPVLVNVKATYEDAISHGYHHPNCRHTDLAYIPGMQLPEPVEVPREVVEQKHTQAKNRQIVSQARTQVREAERCEAVALTPGGRDRAQGLVRDRRTQLRKVEAQAAKVVGKHAVVQRVAAVGEASARDIWGEVTPGRRVFVRGGQIVCGDEVVGKKPTKAERREEQKKFDSRPETHLSAEGLFTWEDQKKLFKDPERMRKLMGGVTTPVFDEKNPPLALRIVGDPVFDFSPLLEHAWLGWGENGRGSSGHSGHAIPHRNNKTWFPKDMTVREARKIMIHVLEHPRYVMALNDKKNPVLENGIRRGRRQVMGEWKENWYEVVWKYENNQFKPYAFYPVGGSDIVEVDTNLVSRPALVEWVRVRNKYVEVVEDE